MSDRTDLTKDIRRRAEHRLKQDARLHEEGVDLHVACEDDRLRLSGEVARLSQRYYAEEDVRKSAGGALPLPLVNEVLVGSRRPDGGVRDHVLHALMQDRYIDETAIDVEVKNGVVTLRGKVESLMRKRLAGAICWWIRGVRDVRNELEVLHPEADSDDMLAEAIEVVLDKDPLVDHSEVTAIVHAGRVHLIGTVASDSARDAAEQDAWAVLGTKHVQNDIEVAPPPTTTGTYRRELG